MLNLPDKIDEKGALNLMLGFMDITAEGVRINEPHVLWALLDRR